MGTIPTYVTTITGFTSGFDPVVLSADPILPLVWVQTSPTQMEAFDCLGTSVQSLSLNNDNQTVLAKLNTSAAYSVLELNSTLFNSDGLSYVNIFDTLIGGFFFVILCRKLKIKTFIAENLNPAQYSVGMNNEFTFQLTL